VSKFKVVLGRDKLHENFGTRNFEVQSESFTEFHLRLLSVQTNQSPSCAWGVTLSKISFSFSSRFFSVEEIFLHIDRHIMHLRSGPGKKLLISRSLIQAIRSSTSLAYTMLGCFVLV